MENSKTVIYEGIEYTLPRVYLLQESGIGVSEYGARVAYDSFDKSENKAVQELNFHIDCESSQEVEVPMCISALNAIESSELLDSLAWVHFHHSVLELANMSYLVKGMSRGTLVEFSRHRHQSLTVRSTRYTGSGILNAFCATGKLETFIHLALQLDMFVTTNIEYNILELEGIYRKLQYQYTKLGHDVFLELALSKDARTNGALTLGTPQERFDALQASKAKRNALDPFKHIITDNFKVDLVFNMNLRSLKNFMELRNSGAAWFQIRWLAEEIIKVTPIKYLKLIMKEDAINKVLI